MKKVVVQFDEQVKFFNNVTKVQCFCAGDFFDAHLDIYEGEKKTVVELYKINGFEVKED